MRWRRRRRYGRLDMQIALTLVGIAVVAVVVTIVVGTVTFIADADRSLTRQEAVATRAAARGAAVTYRPAGWARALAPVIATAEGSDEAIQVRDRAGRVVRASPGFASVPAGPVRTAAIRVHRQLVGWVTLKFDNRGIAKIITDFETRRWQARMIAAGIGVAAALIASLLIAPLVVGPVDRLTSVTRARGAGQRQARAGQVRGLRGMRELALNYDQMVDLVDSQDEMRCNLVAYLAHELRTPICVLQAITEAMTDGVIEPTPDNVESLHGQAVKLGQLVDKLQRLASAEAAATQLATRPEDLAKVAAAAADDLASVVRGAGVRLSRRLRPVQVQCDQERMREVVTNLLTNAAKFTPRGGQIVLETGSSGRQAILRVSDTGIGIPPEVLPLITTRFYRGPGVSGISGSGLGLAIVDELVRAHQGTVTITSEPGKGTQVTVLLPLSSLIIHLAPKCAGSRPKVTPLRRTCG